MGQYLHIFFVGVQTQISSTFGSELIIFKHIKTKQLNFFKQQTINLRNICQKLHIKYLVCLIPPNLIVTYPHCYLQNYIFLIQENMCYLLDLNCWFYLHKIKLLITIFNSCTIFLFQNIFPVNLYIRAPLESPTQDILWLLQ